MKSGGGAKRGPNPTSFDVEGGERRMGMGMGPNRFRKKDIRSPICCAGTGGGENAVCPACLSSADSHC